MDTSKIGQRIRLDDSKGTIKYVGPIDGQTGEWVGIDWDDSSRGKHNGSVKGKCYFQTRLIIITSILSICNYCKI